MFLKRLACHYEVIKASRVKSLLNIVVTQTTAIFQLLLVKDKLLLIWRDSFFVLNLCFHDLDGLCGSTSRVVVFSANGLTNICVPP